MDLQQQLITIQQDLGLISSEIVLMVGAMGLLIAGLFKVPLFGIKSMAAGLLVLAMWLVPTTQGLFFDQTLLRDDQTYFLSHLLPMATLVVVMFKFQKHQNYEFYFLMISVLVGAMFMLGANNFLILYIAIEFTSYGSYLLTGFRFYRLGSEASIKYLLFGGVSSAVMIFGISLLYGANLSLYFQAFHLTPMSAIGLLLFMVGLLFKTSVVPFHLWTPATYEGAPTDAVAFLSVVPKIAGFAVLYHILSLVGHLHPFVIDLILILAIGSIILGTLGALLQTDVKRMLSYGAIAHSGMILPLCLFEVALGAFKYYVIIYAIMNVTAFLFIQLHEREGNVSFSNLAGLGAKHPFMGFLSVIWSISLVGLPPTAGFIAKFFLFSTAWVSYLASGSGYWMAFIVIGVLSSTVALYFYLRLPYFYFFKPKSDLKLTFHKMHMLLLTVLTISLIYLFLQPDILDKFAPILKP